MEKKIRPRIYSIAQNDKNMTKKTKKTLVLIDSNALVHRAFHALPPLTKKDGTPSGAVYGFALTLLSVMEQLEPDHIMAAFDLKGPTFRHKKYKEYKATRTKAPDELYQQIPIIKDMLKAYGIPIYEKKGFEADDVIGTLSKDEKIEKEFDTVIVTGDLDALQLVDEDTKVFTLRKGIKDTVIYDEKAVKKRFELDPSQIVDYKSLRGDASDNIPGVKGIGEKTATKLLKEFGSLDGVYENIEKITPESVRKKLIGGKDDARMSFDLARIRTNVEIDLDLNSSDCSELSKQKLADFFREMEFFSLHKRIVDGGDEGKIFQEEKKLTVSQIKNDKEFEDLIKEAKEQKEIAISMIMPVYSVSSMKNKCLGMAMSVDGKRGYFSKDCENEKLCEILLDDSVLKVGFDLKKEQKLFHEFKGKYFSNFFDVKIAAYLLDAGSKVELEKLVFKEFGAQLKHQDDSNGQASLLEDVSEFEFKKSAEKVAWTLILKKEFEKKIEDISKDQKLKKGASLRTLFWKLEMPVVKTITQMETNGVKVLKENLENVSKLTEDALEGLEKKIHDLAKENFNINSPSQLAKVLYEKLEVSTVGIKKGKTGFSTNAEQLGKIRELHSIVPLVEKYRELFKMKTTYADALPGLVANDGRIHANFNQAVTATGRLSSSDPNLQNIPKRGELADKIRNAFVAEKDKILVSADYSQIDLRVAAHLSEDEKLIQAFKQGQDIHRATAAWVNGISPEKVTKKQRSEAKSLNFGILYGMGLYGFMRDSGVSKDRAQEFIDRYMENFSSLRKYIEQTKVFARENEFVETELGRRRYLPNINASNVMIRSAAERMAVNLPIQGLSADIMKIAMIKTAELLNKKFNKTASLILQIHDELIFEVDKKVADDFGQELKKVMESVYELKVPLVVDVRQGKNWSDL